jgi:hypothetical protein
MSMTYVALLIDNLHGDLLMEVEVLRQLLGVLPLVVLAVFVCIMAVRGAMLWRLSSTRISWSSWRSSSDLCADLLGQHLARRRLERWRVR